ncbi:hypothetical protein CMEL01_12325 [Colletotrichum melonis]|uniref:Uncharacterized protein n=3 Tax=Colletotrichum acutatum species complex TaxID=2707335 RepID=A0AAI9XVW9_9PEZI|nr:uncharacterized protein CTAM01_14147 [Colletotrichum tamarilloi]KAK0380010.1 hypothetical protein CLIM01_02637 [Colletotrichum limetticola]KAK1464970.1 hypothetical protein CMEL01_12325 [Colletotrichum melonis]KAK1480964.1 hypothetical protein CTAM01_14147 [Colletotrichum tamarilloi]
MALSSEEAAHLHRQAKRRAERAAAEMNFREVTSEEYLKKLRAKRRPGRRFEIDDTPAAVEIGEEPLHPQREFKLSTGSERQRTHTRTKSTPTANTNGLSSGSRRTTLGGPIARNTLGKASVPSQRLAAQQTKSQPNLFLQAAQQRTNPAITHANLGTITTVSSLSAQPQRSKSSLSMFYPKKHVRRAASVSVLSSKPLELDPIATAHHSGHARSQSLGNALSVVDTAPQPVALKKRGSLRMLKDKIRRVASSFELRSTRSDGSGSSDDDGLKSRSSKSLLLRTKTRFGSQHRLGTVSEE